MDRESCFINCQPKIFCNQKLPGPIRTANIGIGKFRGPTVLIEDHALVSCLYKSGSHYPLFSKAQVKHWLRFKRSTYVYFIYVFSRPCSFYYNQMEILVEFLVYQRQSIHTYILFLIHIYLYLYLLINLSGKIYIFC